MCSNQNCPSKNKCYRFMAKPDSYQTYSEFIVPKNRKKCDSFVPIREVPTEIDWLKAKYGVIEE